MKSAPNATAKPHHITAMLAVIFNFVTAIQSGPAGWGASIAVLCVMPFARRIDRKAPLVVLPAAFVGGLIGAYFEGTLMVIHETSTMGRVSRFIGDSVTHVILIGVLTAGIAGVIIAALLRWSANKRIVPKSVREGHGALTIAVVYWLIVSIASPEFSSVRTKAYQKSMDADLRNLASQQEIYHDSTQAFASTLHLLGDFQPSLNNHIAIDKAFSTEWSATVWSDVITSRCRISGSAAGDGGAAVATAPVCDNHRQRWF